MVKKGGWLLITILFLLAFSSLALGFDEELVGKENHMKLLAVQEVRGKYNGSEADLYLELKEGSGRVFLETFPLTKMDTQISTRFAKEIACDYFGLDCKGYDFIYTIKAKSNIVGGPSAGAAIAALTAITVLDLEYDKKTTITGTINSGGIVGPVGGVKEKLEAASKNELERVLIAGGSGSFSENNKTVDLVELARENFSLRVKEVGDLNEVVFELTGQELKENNISVEISSSYQEIMEELAGLLCGRTAELEKELEGLEIEGNKTEEIKEKINSSELSLEKEDFYSAASFCFGANILAKKLLYEHKKVGLGWLRHEMGRLGMKVRLLEEKLEKEKVETISDLQTRMVVKERLSEVKERIVKFNESEDRRYALAHAGERFFSAVSWMYFFKMEGKEFVLDKEKLKDSCQKKISESEERYQYVELIFRGLGVRHIREKIDLAIKNLEEEEPELCLIQAIQAKAEANAILSSMGLTEENLDSFLESKFRAVEKVIAENSVEGVFPILGYSYYQYANTLVEAEPSSALLYLEYALEMSELDIYFEEESIGEEQEAGLKLSKEGLMVGGGFIVGFLAALVIVFGVKMIRGRKKGRRRKR